MSLVTVMNRVPDILKMFAQERCDMATTSEDWPDLYEVSIEELEELRGLLQRSIVFDEWMEDFLVIPCRKHNKSENLKPSYCVEDIQETLDFIEQHILYPVNNPLFVRPYKIKVKWRP